MFASAFMRLVLKRRVGLFLRVRLLPSGGPVLPLLRDAAAWCGRILTNRWLLTVVVAGTLAVETLSCLAGPQHPLKLTPCYWDIVQLPGKFVSGVLQAVAWLVGRMAAELVR